MKYIILLLICLISISSEAQIFGRIADRAKDKISQKVEDKVVERISDEIAKAAMKPIDRAIDDMLKEKYEQDSINGRTDADYGEFLNAFLKPVDLPKDYTFDMTLIAETKDYDGDKAEMEMMLTKDGSAIGIVQLQEKQRSMIVFDVKNDIMAIYTEEDEKKVQALPSMLSLAGKMSNVEVKEEDKVTIERTGKIKKILEYECDEYLIEDIETITKAYVASDFPITWQESYGPFLRQMLPTTRRESMPEGMLLKSEAKTKKKGKKSKFEVKKIIDTPTTIDNSQYKQESYSAEEE